MNETEAARVAAATNIVRPEWPEKSLYTFLTNETNNLMRHPYRDVLLALMYVAADPASTTPARVKGAGPWWKVGGREDEPTRANRCACGDVHTLTAPCRTQAPSPRWRDHIQQARATVRATTKEEAADG